MRLGSGIWAGTAKPFIASLLSLQRHTCSLPYDQPTRVGLVLYQDDAGIGGLRERGREGKKEEGSEFIAVTG